MYQHPLVFTECKLIAAKKAQGLTTYQLASPVKHTCVVSGVESPTTNGSISSELYCYDISP